MSIKAHLAAFGRAAVFAHAKGRALKYLGFFGDSIDEDMDSHLRRVPMDARPEVEMWLYLFEEMFGDVERASKKAGNFTEDELDAIDWLFYSQDGTPGSLGFCCELLSSVLGIQSLSSAKGRFNLLRNEKLISLKERFDQLVEAKQADRTQMAT